MPTRVSWQAADLSGYPDLLVRYLGMRVNHLHRIRTFFSLGRKISQSVAGARCRTTAAGPAAPPREPPRPLRGGRGAR